MVPIVFDIRGSHGKEIRGKTVSCNVNLVNDRRLATAAERTVWTRVARWWYVLKPKIQIWGKF
jgi:hypothetical protein